MDKMLITSFVCESKANRKSLLSKTQNNAKNNTIAIGEK